MLTAQQLQYIITGTVAVMTLASDHRDEWRKRIVNILQQAQEQGLQDETDFLIAVLAILDGTVPMLPDNNLYREVLADIQAGITGDAIVFAISEETFDAVQSFINAEDWATKRQILEVRQDVLLKTEVEFLLEAEIAKAQENGDVRISEDMVLHLALLRDCRNLGIASTFSRLEG